MHIINLDFTNDPQGLPAKGFEYYVGRPNTDPTDPDNQLAVFDGQGGERVTNFYKVGIDGRAANASGSETPITPWIEESEYSLTILSSAGGLWRHYKKITSDGGSSASGGSTQYKTLADAQTSQILSEGFDYIEVISKLEPGADGPLEGAFYFSTGGTGSPGAGNANIFYDANGAEFKRTIEQKVNDQMDISCATDSSNPNAVILTPRIGQEIYEYKDGLTVKWAQGNSNTGAMTININGIGDADVIYRDVSGNAVNTVRHAVFGDCEARYIESLGKFLLVNTASNLFGFVGGFQEFTSDDTWQVPENVARIQADAIGGGGGGDALSALASRLTSGGEGGHCKAFINSMPEFFTLTIGEGGNGAKTVTDSSPYIQGTDGTDTILDDGTTQWIGRGGKRGFVSPEDELPLGGETLNDQFGRFGESGESASTIEFAGEQRLIQAKGGGALPYGKGGDSSRYYDEFSFTDGQDGSQGVIRIRW